jgi:iron complex transport system substrate-binding protein
MAFIAAAALALLPGSAEASRQLTDEVGRQVTVPDHPRRIVCLAPSLTETVYALEDGDAVVGVTNYTTFVAGAQQKPSVGELLNPSLEKVVALRPDLVLATEEVNTRESVEQLERYKIPVYVVDPKGLSGILNSVRDIGAAIDHQQVADTLASDLGRRWKAVAARVQNLRRPTILVVIWPDPVISAGKNTFISEAINAAGGRSATDDISQDWPQISMEAVVRRAPEFLLIGAHKSITADRLRRQPGWKEVAAVQQNRIIYIDERLEHSSPVLFDALEELAGKLHPDAFSHKEASR